MKSASLLVAFLLVAGCASSSGDARNALADKVQVQLGQYATNNNLYYFAGPINVQFQFAITNNTGETITLRRLQLRTVSPGAYALRTPTSPITSIVPAGKTTTVNLSAWGRTSGSTLRAEEPVTIQGTAYFDSPRGSFVKIFNQMLSQMGQ